METIYDNAAYFRINRLCELLSRLVVSMKVYSIIREVNCLRHR